MLGRRTRRRNPYASNFGGRSSGKIRVLMALAVAAFSLISYCNSREINPITGEAQYLSLTEHQEIALGQQSAPKMIQQHGGLYPDQNLQNYIDQVGMKLVQSSEAKDTNWQFDFHLLRDPQTVNAFALPGGQIFITAALYNRFSTEGQLAGVLGHEIGHVIARHSAQRMAKAQLTQGLTQSVMVAAGDANSGQAAAVIGQLINMKFGREDELESDELGVDFMADAGYDPRALIQVMDILEQASGGGNRPPEFFSTHPNSENRKSEIEAAIRKRFPNGVPSGLKP